MTIRGTHARMIPGMLGSGPFPNQIGNRFVGDISGRCGKPPRTYDHRLSRLLRSRVCFSESTAILDNRVAPDAASRDNSCSDGS
jgi:hypothetical protein